jgi:hypothetical protein
MSRVWVRFALCGALLTAGGGIAAGVAGAASIESMITGALEPSAAPSLLGPITEAGRKGWACKPEQAASASNWRQAELPDASTP